eukprot:TRINITY_DN7444_c0_g1_i1.p1 TRINITY_DN7444_c0_g1~~TRINITY_DN7444_c0_g1_i1.p1  ORF type:complete len:471 (+),score=101.76 TRINITY_DN7444_c0_g1_i1:7-1419(+)
MCRFIVYIGSYPIQMKKIILESKHNIFSDSMDSSRLWKLWTEFHQMSDILDFVRRNHKVNADGCGIGFYIQHLTEPIKFKSILPCWSNRNMMEISNNKSSLFFAHIRAALPMSNICEANSHPFSFGKFLWMHNGGISKIDFLKPKILLLIGPKLTKMIQGTTDTELCGALYVHLLPRKNKGELDLYGEYTEREMSDTMERMLGLILRMQDENNEDHHESDPNSCNFCVSDGNIVIASRFRNANIYSQPPTLFYFEGDDKVDIGKSFTSSESLENYVGTVIASEPLTDDIKHWHLIPKNNLIVGKKNEKAKLIKIGLPQRWIRRVLYRLADSYKNPLKKSLKFFNLIYNLFLPFSLPQSFLCCENVVLENFLSFGEIKEVKNVVEEIRNKLINPFKKKYDFTFQFHPQYQNLTNQVYFKVDHLFLFDKKEISFPILYLLSFTPKSEINLTLGISSIQFFLDNSFLLKNVFN